MIWYQSVIFVSDLEIKNISHYRQNGTIMSLLSKYFNRGGVLELLNLWSDLIYPNNIVDVHKCLDILKLNKLYWIVLFLYWNSRNTHVTFKFISFFTLTAIQSIYISVTVRNIIHTISIIDMHVLNTTYTLGSIEFQTFLTITITNQTTQSQYQYDFHSLFYYFFFRNRRLYIFQKTEFINRTFRT